MELQDKVALITGGATGIGYAIVSAFLENGAKGITIADINKENAEKAVLELKKKYGENRVILVVTDVTKDSDYENAFQRTIENFHQLDIVVNNAGICRESEYWITVDINLTSTIRGTLLGIKYLSKTEGGKGGVILNIASIAGLMSFYEMPTYVATKHGVIGLVKSFGHPYHCEKSDITIMALCPGFTAPTLIFQNNVYESEDKNKQLANDKLLKYAEEFEIQRPEKVGGAAVYTIKHGQTGSVWVIEGGKLFKANIPEKESYQEFVTEII